MWPCAQATGNSQYMEFYHKCWAYSWEHLADRELGGWYGVLDRPNQGYKIHHAYLKHRLQFGELRLSGQSDGVL